MYYNKTYTFVHTDEQECRKGFFMEGMDELALEELLQMKSPTNIFHVESGLNCHNLKTLKIKMLYAVFQIPHLV